MGNWYNFQEGNRLVAIEVALSDIGVLFGEDAELARSKAALDVNTCLCFPMALA